MNYPLIVLREEQRKLTMNIRYFIDNPLQQGKERKKLQQIDKAIAQLEVFERVGENATNT